MYRLKTLNISQPINWQGVIIDCNLCGRDFARLNQAEIEGTIIDVCDKCARFGTKIIPKEEYKPVMPKLQEKELIPNEIQLIPDYGKTIKLYRETKGMTRNMLAKILAQKESVLKRVEDELIEPDEKLVKKLEGFLGVKLLQRYEEKYMQQVQRKRPKLTVGDIVRVK